MFSISRHSWSNIVCDILDVQCPNIQFVVMFCGKICFVVSYTSKNHCLKLLSKLLKANFVKCALIAAALELVN